MRAELDYQGPELLAAAVLEKMGTRNALDVLDLGCGTGLMGRHLRPLACSLTGVDLSAEMLQRARRTGCYDRLHIDEITRWLGRGTGPSFDLMAACDTLIYFGDLSQVVLPAASRLRRGGRLAFSLEKGSQAGPFRLTDSGRYTHTEHHLLAVAARARLSVDLVRTEILRYEYGEPVEGLLAVLTCG